ncbi:MAG: hypothetical protein ABW023_00885 [Sphingomonas sp.]
MHFASYILPLVAAFTPPDDDAPAVTSRFLTYLEQGETAKAAAMLTRDAMMAAGDVGGPFLVEALPFARLGCTRRSVADTARPLSSDKPNIRVVAVTWTCLHGAEPGPHVRKGTFLIDGQKVAGLYIG